MGGGRVKLLCLFRTDEGEGGKIEIEIGRRFSTNMETLYV